MPIDHRHTSAREVLDSFTANERLPRGFVVSGRKEDKHGNPIIEAMALGTKSKIAIAFVLDGDVVVDHTVRWVARGAMVPPVETIEAIVRRIIRDDEPSRDEPREPSPSGARDDALARRGARLADGEGVLEGWMLTKTAMIRTGAVELTFEPREGHGIVSVFLEPKDDKARFFTQTRFFNVSYSVTGDVSRDDSGALIEAVVPTLDLQGADIIARYPSLLVATETRAETLSRMQLLTAGEGGDDATDEGQASPGGGTALITLGDLSTLPPGTELPYDAEGLAKLLAPELGLGAQFGGTWTLTSIFLDQKRRKGEIFSQTYVIRFAGPDEALQDVTIRPRDDSEDRFLATAHFNVGIKEYGTATQRDEADHMTSSALISYVATFIKLKDHEDVTIRFPSSLAEVAVVSLGMDARKEDDAEVETPTTAPEDQWFNLAVNSDCRLACAFCSIRKYNEPYDGGETDLAEVTRALGVAHAKGIRKVRINGFDPLTFSRIFDVLAEVRKRGFTEVTIYTTGQPLADRGFAERLVAALPGEFLISLPIHGHEAAVHDAVTRTPGSFDRLMAAIDNITQLAGSHHLKATIVLTTINQRALARTLTMVEHLRIATTAHLAYPCSNAPDDIARDIIPRMTDILDDLHDELGALAAEGALPTSLVARIPWILNNFHPCVRLAAKRRHGGFEIPWFDLEVEPFLPGTEYSSDEYTHGDIDSGVSHQYILARCPHARRCAAASLCAKVVQGVYRDKYGLGELTPISPLEMFDDAYTSPLSGEPRRSHDINEETP